MQVKGTTVKSTIEFVKNKFPESYDEWFNKLPEASKSILKETISATGWYPMKEAYLYPTTLVGKLFYDDIYDAAFQLGLHSAKIGLTGIYKVFIRIATPKFILARGLKMFSSYFKPSNVRIDIQTKSLFHFYIYQFSESDKVAIYRVAGWMKQALILINQKNIDLKIDSFEENEQNVFRIICSWG